MILLNKTYQVVTEESAQDGDSAESGFEWEDQPYTFKELVELLQECSEVSCFPVDGDTNEWASMSPDTDMHDGSETMYSVHYSRNNSAKNAKYWRKAMLYVFGKK